MRTLIIILALALVLIGLFWPVFRRLPLFRLPRDLVVKRPGTTVYIPITSILILSLLLILLLRVLR